MAVGSGEEILDNSLCQFSGPLVLFQHNPHAGAGPVTLPWALFEECRAHAEVSVTHPLVIVHGLSDAVIPVQRGVALAARSPGLRRLYAVPDGHRLMGSLPTVREALAYLSPS